MTDAQFKDLDRFVAYSNKQFDLPLLAGCFADGRADPQVPSRAAGLSLLLGEVVQVGSLLQLEEETKTPQWQRWVGYHDRISHDTFGDVSNRMNPEPRVIHLFLWVMRKLLLREFVEIIAQRPIEQRPGVTVRGADDDVGHRDARPRARLRASIGSDGQRKP